MNTPFSNGVIHQQDIRDRSIARQRIAEGIAREAQRTGILVNLAIARINQNPNQLYSLDAIWNALQHDAALSQLRLRISDNVFDYPGFTPWVDGSRRRLEETEKNRLRKAIRKPEYRHRFANTIGFRPAFI
jgi:hypothetical protein